MPAPKWKEKKKRRIQKCIKEILTELGYDTKDENFKHTPQRVATQWFDELYRPIPSRKLFTVIKEQHDQMIVLVGHETWTRCPHHLEKVKLTVSIGYIPNEYILGLSKPARIADFFAKGLVLQEEYADQLAEGLWQALKPKGVGVYVIGEHGCMRSRGVKTSGVVVTTSLKGLFLEDPATREEFLNYCQRRVQ